jgi:[histone H3]-lysine36 N-trimethyltransferase
MEQEARLARLERTKAETAGIIAAAAAAQKAAEERALVEAAAAAEEQSKQDERNAERERRRKERKERERSEKRHHDRDGEVNREKRLLKLVGAVVVKTMSKYRTRMDVDTFKKHAKEVRGLPTSSGLFSLTKLVVYSSHILLRRRKRNRRVTRTISSRRSQMRKRTRSKSSPGSISKRSYIDSRKASAAHQTLAPARLRSRMDTTMATQTRQRHRVLRYRPYQHRRCMRKEATEKWRLRWK